MFPFSQNSPTEPLLEATATSAKSRDHHPLDALTQGAFSAPTSSERLTCLRQWLTSEPSLEQLQQVFRELSAKDKGAAKLLREKINDIKRQKNQALAALEWADKARALLEAPRLNLADALAWQRDAAKAGAPLSKEPLVDLKARLAEQVHAIEDLQHRVQVQREAAVLLAQRIEVLSTKPWREAKLAQEGLGADIEHWRLEAQSLIADANWPSVEARFVSQLQDAQAQLSLVWDAFVSALNQAVLAAQDATLALPNVPVWADELRALHGLAVEPAAKAPPVDPQIKAQATAVVSEALTKLEQELALGHSKASSSAAGVLRQALKEFGRLIDDQLENQARSALAGAGELEGWQRWHADQSRQELVSRAEALLQPGHASNVGGRKLQETLRSLREQWKQIDQNGASNHGLWKRFDDACNEAHKVVEAWLDKIKAEVAQHRAQRLALIEEVKAWAGANPSAQDDDWKGFSRLLQHFGERWRACGHVGDKMYAELNAIWRAAINEAAAPLQALRKTSLAARHAMIEEARLLSSQQPLHLDAIKALQKRWQAEAHRVSLERNHEQKLWDAFRKPIDEAFQRKSAQREQAQHTLSDRDRMVLQAAQALQEANASSQASAIKAAMAALQAALHGQIPAPVAASAPDQPESAAIEPGQESDQVQQQEAAPAPAGVEAARAAPRKPVLAMRGDDRPNMKKDSPGKPERDGKFGARKDNGRNDQRAGLGGSRRFDTRADSTSSERLGTAAFRAQQEALEQAQLALRKLAAAAHGEALTHLLEAWQTRQPEQLPGAQEFGPRLTPAWRNDWLKALTAPPQAQPDTALLRLEIAAEVPSPAEHLSQRRLLQLQLLTQKRQPAPAQTWAQDCAVVLSSAFDADAARRLQNALKVLLKP